VELVPFQQAPSPPMTPELREACRRALHVLTREGQLLRGGRAALFVLERTRLAPLARVGWLPPFVWLVRLGYRLVADNRRFFARFLFRTPEDR
jgi:predicted DCC family thiol-disulfide oxidoreductase YuxK